MVLLLKPKRGGFLRPFGCGIFIKHFLLGDAPYGSDRIDTSTGAYQALIFKNYKEALIRETALDRATRAEERRARKEQRRINPDNIDKLYKRYMKILLYKSGCTYHSFVIYFSMPKKLMWVEPTGEEEPSQFQDNYPEGQSRKYFRITAAGMAAPDSDWANPHRVLYG